MNITRHQVDITTDGSGAGTGYTPVVSGRVLNVIYVKNNFADTVDFTVTTEKLGQNVWTEANVTANKTVAPGQPTHTQAGVPVVQGETSSPVNDYLPVANDRVKVVVANGGNATTGRFYVIIG
jgi:hypothetical protein